MPQLLPLCAKAIAKKKIMLTSPNFVQNIFIERKYIIEKQYIKKPDKEKFCQVQNWKIFNGLLFRKHIGI
jgi:hypothetical protein